MANVVGDLVGKWIPSMDGVTTFIIWIGIGLVVAIVAVAIGWYIIQSKKYNQTLLLFNEFWKVKARIPFTIERIGVAGDTWGKSKKGKIFKIPKNEIEKGVWIMLETKDREWRDFEFEDFQQALKRVNIKISDEDVRLARIAISRIVKDEFEKKDWKEYIPMIANVAMILIICIFGIVLISKMSKLIPAFANVATTCAETAKMCVQGAVEQGTGGLIPVAPQI